MCQKVKEYQLSNQAFVFSKAYPATGISAKYKTYPEDFYVKENITIDFSEEGEHCWLYIQKQNCNTDWLAQQLARYCEVKPVAVSYAGLKDRHAVTSQWFSVHLPGQATPDWRTFEQSFNSEAAASNDTTDGDKTTDTDASEQRAGKIQILKDHRHNKKLKRGALQGNTF